MSNGIHSQAPGPGPGNLPGFLAHSDNNDGLIASTASSSHSGVIGRNDDSSGNIGSGASGCGVLGVTQVHTGAGVFGANIGKGGAGRGVQGNGSPDGVGLDSVGVGGFSPNGIGVLAQSGNIGIQAMAPTAGHFEGDVELTGELRFLGGQDCAESFAAVDATAATPGTVMVLDDSGAIRVADSDYDHRVAGVVSGAGEYRPALTLRGVRHDDSVPLAIFGKVYCKVDATIAPIGVGDLLTTSSTPGHAMKAVDTTRAFGAVIGKALQGCSGEHGLIPILVALQ